MNSQRCFLGGALLVALAFLSGCSSSRALQQPRLLFNGHDLSGWTYHLAKPDVPMDAVWRVENGVLVCQGEPLGYLATGESFTNFRLTLEWRWAPGTEPGNSGVLMRINGEPRPLPRCLEAQLQHGNAGDLLGLQAMGINGDPARLNKILGHAMAGDITIVKKRRPLENPPGEWNSYEIELRDGSLQAWVNGFFANEASDCEIASGPIALQSEGGQIHFRRIEITPLP